MFVKFIWAKIAAVNVKVGGRYLGLFPRFPWDLFVISSKTCLVQITDFVVQPDHLVRLRIEELCCLVLRAFTT
jgi:hypothetical protein